MNINSSGMQAFLNFLESEYPSKKFPREVSEGEEQGYRYLEMLINDQQGHKQCTVVIYYPHKDSREYHVIMSNNPENKEDDNQS